MEKQRIHDRPVATRLKIPSLRSLLENRSAQGFQALRQPLADRAIYPEDLGTPAAAHRPDLVPVQIGQGVGQRLKMSRQRIWSGRLR